MSPALVAGQSGVGQVYSASAQQPGIPLLAGPVFRQGAVLGVLPEARNEREYPGGCVRQWYRRAGHFGQKVGKCDQEEGSGKQGRVAGARFGSRRDKLRQLRRRPDFQSERSRNV